MVRRYKRVPTSPAIVIEKQFLRQRLFLFFTVDKRAFVTFRANNMKIPIQQCLIFLHLQIESSKLDVDCIKINSVKMCFFLIFFWVGDKLHFLIWNHLDFMEGLELGCAWLGACVHFTKGAFQGNIFVDSVFQKATKGAQSRLQPTPL
jgi:hypothetical protein